MKKFFDFVGCRKYTIALALLIVIIAFLPADARAQTVTVLERSRIGGNSEDITFVSTGALANHLIVLDGYEVYGVPGQAQGKAPLKKLFDLKSLGLEAAPRGITYIESEKLFVTHNDFPQPDTLFLFDHKGRPQGRRTIQYLNGYFPVHLEGLAYLPANASAFPDHLLMIAYDDNPFFPSFRIEIIRRDGQVVAEIVPNIPDSSVVNGAGDVTFLPPNHLLVTFYDNTIWTIDFAGNVTGDPQIVVSNPGGEGIVQMRDGRIAYVAFPQDLHFFDNQLNRLPDADRHDVIGLNLNRPSGIAWNSNTNQHLILHLGNLPLPLVSAVSASLANASPLIDLAADGFFRSQTMSYLPDEHLIAIAHNALPRTILLYNNNGNLVEQVNLGAAPFKRPIAITYIPATQQFAVTVNGEPSKLHIYSRTGALVRTLDLASIGVPAIVSVAYFNASHPSGGQFLIFEPGFTDRAVITDFNGNFLGDFNYVTALGVLNPRDVAAITTGGQAGAFSLVDPDGSELVIFRVQ